MAVLVAATSDGIARLPLDDRGAPAQAVAGVDVRALAVDPAQPSRLYAGTQGQGVLCSDDGGASWRPCGLDGMTVKALAASACAPGLIFAGTKPPGLFRSHDGGGTWRECPAFARMRRWYWLQPAERPATPYVSTLAASPTDPDVLLAGIEAAKLLRTTDGGISWSRVGRGVAWDCHELAFHARDGRCAYEAAGSGASVTRDGGATWKRLRTGLDRRYGFCLAIDPDDQQRAYLAAAPMRTAHTGNARARIFVRKPGRGWVPAAGGLPAELGRLPYALVASPLAPSEVFAGLGDGTVWRSPDRGESWRALEASFAGLRRLVVADAPAAY